MPLKRPLNPDAVAAADKKLAEKTGGRKLTMGPEDKALRKEWLEAYKAAGGESAGGSGTKPPEPIPCTVLPCGLKVYKFVGRYTYADGTGVPGAQYVLKDMGDKELAKGTTDGEGRFKKEELTTPYAYFEVSKDPNPNKYEIVPAATPEPAEESASILDNLGEWTWGALQGDFNKEQTISQIVVNALIGLIPVVDQALDVRDIVANLYHLVDYYLNEDKRNSDQIKEDNEAFFGLGREFELWFNMVVTAIGCVPVAGSAAKGVIKTLFKLFREIMDAVTPHQLKQVFTAVAEVLNKFGKFNAKKWLEDVLKPNLANWCDKAKDLIRKAVQSLETAMDSVKGKLSSIPDWMPGYERARQLVDQMARWKTVLPKIKGKIDSMVNKVRDEIKKLVDKVLKSDVPNSKGGVSNGEEVVLKQGKAEPRSLDSPKRFWTKKKDFRGNRVYQRDDLIDPNKVDKMGRTNMERMKKGLAPLGPDGKPMNLHHMLQTQDGAIAEMTQTFHQSNHKVIHINPNTVPSGIDRNAFDSWKRAYWKDRAADFGG